MTLPLITAVTALFRPTPETPSFSRCYSEEWAEKLYRGLKRNYSGPLEFICLTDRDYEFKQRIRTQPLARPFTWHTVLQQAFTVECERMAFMGLDTIITGNLDALLSYTDPLIAPRDPNQPHRACSGFVLSDYKPEIAETTAGNDMEAIQRHHPSYWDELAPGWVKSYKVHVRRKGLGDARVVYFHGKDKPHEIMDGNITRYWY